MLVITCNVNGMRAASRKGFLTWVASMQPDVLCLQEIKADAKVCEALCADLDGYHMAFFPALKPGYSGVGILTRLPCQFDQPLGLDWADDEGRLLRARFETFDIVSLYLPSGTQGDVRQAKKMAMLAHLSQWLETQTQPHLLCGDFNIAHQSIDLKNWKQNQKNSGFLPEERAWLDHCQTKGYVDAFRQHHPQEPGYTWWTYRGGARARNVGWRIDHQWHSVHWPWAIDAAWVDHSVIVSDHAPLCVRYRALPCT